MNVGCGNGDGHGVHTALQRRFDVSDNCTVPAHDAGAQTQPADLRDRFFFVAAHDGNPDLDLVHADIVQHFGNADFLRIGKNYSRRLFSITERGIQNIYLVHNLASPRQVWPLGLLLFIR